MIQRLVCTYEMRRGAFFPLRLEAVGLARARRGRAPPGGQKNAMCDSLDDYICTYRRDVYIIHITICTCIPE